MTIEEKIINKLDDNLYVDLNTDMIVKLSNESERGAILIGTSKIEEYLQILLQDILPIKTKNYQRKLLDYPGPLSSFSSKIELLFAFRYITSNFRVSLNTLRSLRNSAAHSYDDFKLENEDEKIYIINSFYSDDLRYVIDELALLNMLEIKKKKLIRIYEEKNIEIDYNLIEEKILELKNTSLKDNQYRIWRLSYGIVFMCLYVTVMIDESKSLNDINTY